MKTLKTILKSELSNHQELKLAYEKFISFLKEADLSDWLEDELSTDEIDLESFAINYANTFGDFKIMKMIGYENDFENDDIDI